MTRGINWLQSHHYRHLEYAQETRNYIRYSNGRPQDSHVLVIISKKEADGTYIVNNVVRCEYKSAVEYEYE
ncbi:MAG TPA: hypothetical protein IAB96_06775 [Candidatus Coprenecus pullicola]|jgi:hypothetical protein|nr:hypothetical protein [Candidatus Coprenecus pullicola]